MEKDWSLVYTTISVQEAQLTKAFLEEHAIAAVIINKQDSTYAFGDIELYVKGDNVIKAKHLIESRNK